ncbi:MAG: alpha/beta fold hydrolase [Kofleriaceae bacterium]
MTTEAAVPRAQPDAGAVPAEEEALSAASPVGSVTATVETIAARDGAPLAATLYRAEGVAPRRVIVVACAMAVRRAFYEAYARFMASQGFAVITFDYRGIAGSLVGKIADSRATLHDWGNLDYPAVLDFARAQFPGVKIGIVGHSIGGQLVGMLQDFEQIDTVCTVAAQHGYWRRYPTKQALKFLWLWYVLFPALLLVLRYFPSQRLKFGEDLPRGVARQWGRSCKSPHYLVDDAGKPIRRGFEAFGGHVRAYYMTDDKIAPHDQVAAFHAYYVHPTVTVEITKVDPAVYQKRSIGHIGFFAPKLKKTLWREHADWWLSRS